MKNLFEKDTKKTKTKASDKETVNVSDLGNPVERMIELREEIAALQAEEKMLYSEVREVSIDQMIKLYESKGNYPGTIRMTADTTEFQFLTSDRYITIDEQRANELVERFGEDIVDEDTTFTFNKSVLERNQEAISEAILNCKDISDNDKENLIDQNTTWKVAKGTVKELKNEKYSKFTVKELIEAIRPVFSIKNLKFSE